MEPIILFIDGTTMHFHVYMPYNRGGEQENMVKKKGYSI